MRITKEWLETSYTGDRMHITGFLKEFGEKFPEGATFLKTAKWLHKRGKYDWLQELFKMVLINYGQSHDWENIEDLISLARKWVLGALRKVNDYETENKELIKQALDYIKIGEPAEKIRHAVYYHHQLSCHIPTTETYVSAIQRLAWAPVLIATMRVIESVIFASIEYCRLDVINCVVGAAFQVIDAHKDRGAFRRKIIRNVAELIGEIQQ